MRSLKLLYYYLKQRYTKGFIFLVLILVLFALFVNLELHINTYSSKSFALSNYFYVYYLSFLLLFYVIFGLRMTISEINFILTSQERADYILFLKGFADSLFLIFLLLYSSIFFVRSIIDLLNTALLCLFLSYLSTLLLTYENSLRYLIGFLIVGYTIITSFLYPLISPIQAITNSSIYYTVGLCILLGAVLATIPKSSMRIYNNAYGLSVNYSITRLGKKERIESSRELPKNILGLLFYTSVYGGFVMRYNWGGTSTYAYVRRNVLLILLPLSFIVTAVLVAFRNSSSVIHVIPLYVIIMYSIYSSTTIQSERLWINFVNVDYVTYIRNRMYVRLLLSWITLLPPSIALLISSQISIDIVILSIPLLICPLGWISASYSKLPQARETNVESSPARIGVRTSISLLSIIALAVIETVIGLISILGSIVLAVINLVCCMVLMYFKPEIWIGVVERLVNNGYV
ncbi:hypothetical protein SUSAZ_07250 [Sulfolobus acidocaldarius SUSAZ]|nr:hypothetical protein SUSAZ_07250 [Sulfolobus acidocaldarius SUSAZ]